MNRNFRSFNWTNVRAWWDVSDPAEAAEAEAIGCVINGNNVHVPVAAIRCIGDRDANVAVCRDIAGVRWALISDLLDDRELALARAR